MTKTTRHKDDCKMAFGRKDPTCPRCQELLAGAAPVVWRGADQKAEQARLISDIRSHKCTKACGPVCTRFEW